MKKTGSQKSGVRVPLILDLYRYEKGNCGVSIVRSGEAMEKALQDCCRSASISLLHRKNSPSKIIK